MKLSKIISELKRRHIFKSAVIYLAVTWVIMQIASIVFPTFDAPDYVFKALVYFLSFGLIFWIGFSWIYYLITEEHINQLTLINRTSTQVLTANFNPTKLPPFKYD
jgi:hypothetical protein